MNIKDILRGLEKSDRIVYAKDFWENSWGCLTVRQVNFLYRYIKIHSI